MNNSSYAQSIILYEGMSWEACREIVGEEVFFEILDNIFFITRKNTSALRFVGILSKEVAGVLYTIYCFPKYMRRKVGELKDSDKKDMGLILQVIEKIKPRDFLSEKYFSELKYNQTKENISRIRLARWIVRDYCNDGLFFFKRKLDTMQHKGRTNWEKTISKVIPLQMKEDIVYTKLVSTYSEKAYDGDITMIQRCVVAEAIDVLKQIGEAENVNVPEYDVRIKSSLKNYTKSIRSFHRRVFSNRDIALLRALEAWCENETNYYYSPCQGTISFELVWEEVLRGVFGHKELNKKYGFGEPIYHFANKDDDYILTGDSIPDGMNFWKDKDCIKFIVIDGKYYLGELSERVKMVKNLPGYKDVAKQIDYFETLTSIYGLDKKKGKNVFALPEWDMSCDFRHIKTEIINGISVRYIGYARKPKASDPIKSIIEQYRSELGIENMEYGEGEMSSNNMVYLVQVEPNSLYKFFLENNPLEEDNASKLWQYLECKI